MKIQLTINSSHTCVAMLPVACELVKLIIAVASLFLIWISEGTGSTYLASYIATKYEMTDELWLAAHAVRSHISMYNAWEFHKLDTWVIVALKLQIIERLRR